MRITAMMCCLVATLLTCGTTFAQSANDNCADRIALTTGVAEAFDTTLDTNDGPTPTCGGATAPIDIWYEYTADCDGVATISLCGSAYDTRVAVYSDLACPAATQIACNDDSCGLQSELSVPVAMGDVLMIQVAGFNAAVGTGTITATCILAATNDDCATPAPALDGLTPVNTTAATTDGLGVDPLSCSQWGGDVELYNDVWFEYTATADGLKTISTCNIVSFDSKIAVWDAATAVCPIDPAVDTALACNDDGVGCAGFSSELQMAMVSGTTYLIQVGGFTATTTGTGDLLIEDFVAPVDAVTCTIDDPITGDITISWNNNDTYADINIFVDGVLSTTVSGMDTTASLVLPSGASYEICVEGDTSGQVCCTADIFPPITNDDCNTPAVAMDGLNAVNTLMATTDGLGVDPATCAQWAGDAELYNDVWFEYTATADGAKTFSTCNIVTFDSKIAIWDAATAVCPIDPAVDTALACNDDGAGCAGFSSELQLNVVNGTTYLIQVGGFTAATTGTGDLLIEDFVAPVTGATCTVTDVAAGNATLTWTENDTYTDINIFEGGVLIATIASGIGSFDLMGLTVGSSTEYCIEGDTSGQSCCTLDIIAPAVDALACDDSVADTLVATWTESLVYDDVNVYVDGVFAAAVGAGTLTYTHMTAPGFIGQVEICVEGVISGAAGPQACCTGTFGGPANDDCVDAIVVGLGDTAFDTTLASDSAEAPSCGLGGSGIWFEHTVAADSDLTISLCGSGYDTNLSIWDVCGGVELACNDDACGLQSEITLPVLAGDVLLIQVAGFNGAQGAGNLNIAIPCGGIDPVDCVFDCGTGEVTVSWTDNFNAGVGYDILENGLLVGSVAAGTTSFVVAAPALGMNTYEVTWACDLGGNGDSGTCDAEVIAPIVIPGGTTDLVLHLEGLEDAGNVGDIDSGTALENALLANSVAAARVAANDFDLLVAGNCLDLSGISTLWIAAGSFPNDYSLSLGEGDLLASLAAGGMNIYLEAGDHWGFQHIDSALDLRDGIEPDAGTNIEDGDDSYTQMDGQNAATAGFDLSGHVDAIYGQDVIVGTDWTDILSLNGTDPMLVQDDVTSAEATWLNSDDGLPAPPSANEAIAYITGVIAVHNDGGVMLSQSWEFGGFGLDHADPAASDAAREALMAEYLGAFGGMPPIGDDFIRGNCNNDGASNIADAIALLGIIFPPATGPFVAECRDACDANDDGNLNIADAIALLGSIFSGGSLPSPWPGCGADPTPSTLDCANPNMGTCP